MRLIDADALIDRIPNKYEQAEVARWVNEMPTIEPEPCEDAVHAAYKHGKSKGIKKGLGMLKDAQPERKRGKWIYYPKASGSVTSTAVHLYPVCSECGREHPVANFCPNCGADMREDAE